MQAQLSALQREFDMHARMLNLVIEVDSSSSFSRSGRLAPKPPLVPRPVRLRRAMLEGAAAEAARSRSVSPFDARSRSVSPHLAGQSSSVELNAAAAAQAAAAAAAAGADDATAGKTPWSELCDTADMAEAAAAANAAADTTTADVTGTSGPSPDVTGSMKRAHSFKPAAWAKSLLRSGRVPRRKPPSHGGLSSQMDSSMQGVPDISLMSTFRGGGGTTTDGHMASRDTSPSPEPRGAHNWQHNTLDSIPESQSNNLPPPPPTRIASPPIVRVPLGAPLSPLSTTSSVGLGAVPLLNELPPPPPPEDNGEQVAGAYAAAPPASVHIQETIRPTRSGALVFDSSVKASPRPALLDGGVSARIKSYQSDDSPSEHSSAMPDSGSHRLSRSGSHAAEPPSPPKHAQNKRKWPKLRLPKVQPKGCACFGWRAVMVRQDKEPDMLQLDNAFFDAPYWPGVDVKSRPTRPSSSRTF